MKKLRGEQLDAQLKKELDDMIQIGYKLAPISRSAIQRRLKLNSRSTLAVAYRAEMIDIARKVQMNNAGFDLQGKKKRNGLQEQNENLKRKIADLEKERDTLIEKMAMIINGAQAKGYDVEEIMMPILH
ncbi:hypothetical protein [Autumnicola musiva]|uniref:Uncharacterized protein n=1 Tax=Autumnicola musiva TaxID=3075589 RepID=A0ABU3D632_9FLAO|nr:hypothetical protein [Zunongwangia sp. F117]MDT0676993.1 hypothetical protein [Zunongwangia sp. F117]